MNVDKKHRIRPYISQESKADKRINHKNLQSFDKILTIHNTPKASRKERDGRCSFDLYLPTHEAKTPISQITMDEIEWMEDLYNECLGTEAPKKPLSLRSSIDNDLAGIIEDILVSTRQKSCLSPQMKQSHLVIASKNIESDQHFPSIFDPSQSLLTDYQNDFPNVSDYLATPEWKRHEKLLLEWRHFFSNKGRAVSTEKGDVPHGQIKIEVPCLEHNSDCKRRTSKRKSRRLKSSTEGVRKTHRKKSRRASKNLGNM
jgi:hypothetical protein